MVYLDRDQNIVRENFFDVKKEEKFLDRFKLNILANFVDRDHVLGGCAEDHL